MAQEYTWRYTVIGTGRFPGDMLRYDRAWIHPVDDLLSLRAELNDGDPMTAHYLPRRSVRIIGQHGPTVGRWQSFGWTVSNVTRTLGMQPNPYPFVSAGHPWEDAE